VDILCENKQHREKHTVAGPELLDEFSVKFGVTGVYTKCGPGASFRSVSVRWNSFRILSWCRAFIHSHLHNSFMPHFSVLIFLLSFPCSYVHECGFQHLACIHVRYYYPNNSIKIASIFRMDWLYIRRALSLGVKRPGREADHSPPSSAEVKECVELYLRCPYTPSWRGAQLKEEAQGQLTLPYLY
jgi:hypothetical protein